MQDIANLATPNLWDVFGTTQKRIPNDLTASSDDQRILNWQPIANGIFRMHISFVLNDGRVVQTPPAYLNFFSNGGMGGTAYVQLRFLGNRPLTLTVHVKGLIVGVVALDETTRNLAYKVDNNFATTIANKIARPTADGETPVQFWNQKLRTLTSNTPGDPNYLFPPVRQSIRFYQRFYNVNL